MKVLLLHGDDSFAAFAATHRWDLVVDLGRAPEGAYNDWRRQAGCEVISLYDFAESQDLQRARELFHAGLGSLVDRAGIDWWDLLSLEIVPDVLQLLRVDRLARKLSASGCVLHASRRDLAADALAQFLGEPIRILESGFRRGLRRLRGFPEIFSRLDGRQLAQVVEDRIDGQHSIRRRLRGLAPAGKCEEVLLPSAYVNGSRMAVAYSALLPEQRFKLIYTRSSGRLASVPANVSTVPLSPYFVRLGKAEIEELRGAWVGCRENLVHASTLWQVAEASGVLRKIPELLPWGISLRDAWNQVFDRNQICACLSTDDSNPPTRIPLLLARQRGIPALSCHHGALDSVMAVKQHYEDYYLAKSEMERDYLLRGCQVPAEKIVAGGPVARRVSVRESKVTIESAGWLVFFTEPYGNLGWRTDEVWRELLPRLSGVAREMKLDLVLKLHPFENAKSYRRWAQRYIPETNLKIITGVASTEFWQRARVAMTVHSSTAIECARRGIPTFLCGWLRDPYNGYIEQFHRFHVAEILDSVEDIAKIPELLARSRVDVSHDALATPLPAETFRNLLHGDGQNQAEMMGCARAEGVVA